MTRDELVDKLEDILCTWEGDPCERYNCAISIMDTIFDALKEPTDEMNDAAWESDGTDWIGEHKVLTGLTHVWQAMLSASPLAPEK